MRFDFHVHGLWIIGSLFLFAGSMLAGNVETVEGTTPFSFWFTVLLAFVLILLAGMFWISAGARDRGVTI